jgi:hypothetical protein
MAAGWVASQLVTVVLRGFCACRSNCRVEWQVLGIRRVPFDSASPQAIPVPLASLGQWLAALLERNDGGRERTRSCASW